jgi:hypothetical protein
MGGSVAYVGVWPGSFKTVPMSGRGKICGDSADLLDEYFRSRLPRGACTGEKGRETTECGATAVISTPSDRGQAGNAPARRPGVGNSHRYVHPAPF